MKNLSKVNTEERPQMIILGVLTLYFLICGFILYLNLLHRIVLSTTLISCGIFTILYLPQFLILKKLKNKDKIKIIDNFLLINGIGIAFADIVDFKVSEHKSKVVFFFNNRMIVFKEAIFHIRTNVEEFHFNVIGTEKIQLLKQYLENTIENRD